MNRTTWISATTAILLLAGVAGAFHYQPLGNPLCDPTDAVHAYTGTTSATNGPHGAGTKPYTWDGSLGPCSGDGDNEIGLGGGRHPGGSWTLPCTTSVPHHASGIGAAYWAIDNNFMDVAFIAATDGPLVPHGTDPIFDCVTNGVITSDPITDPADCVGNLGARGPGGGAIPWFPTHSVLLGPNDPGNPVSWSVPDCEGYDGYTWTFIMGGIAESPCGLGVGTAWLFTPTQGDIFDTWVTPGDPCRMIFIDP